MRTYKGPDQPAYPCNLISVFVVRCLDNTIPILAKSKLQDSSEQYDLSLTWSHTPNTFSSDVTIISQFYANIVSIKDKSVGKSHLIKALLIAFSHIRFLNFKIYGRYIEISSFQQISVKLNSTRVSLL